MKLATFTILSVMLSLGTGAEAGETAKKQKVQRKSAPSYSSDARLPREDGYRELLADKMPIGSNQWWEQMRREGRLGGETP